MLNLKMKQLLALFLCGLVIRPMPMMAAPDTAAPSRAVLGSVTSRGMVRVGEVQVPGMSALFSGDQVRTLAGDALIQYQDGVRVILGNESSASFSSARVELQKGQMSFRTETKGPLFAASSLRIEPTSEKSAANVTLQDRKATVAVTEGSLKVVDPSGVQLAALRVGEARLFEEAAAAMPSPPAAAPAVPPQAGGGSGSRAWLVALGIGVVGTSLGIAGLVRANDADSRADQAATDANQARAQAQAAQAQLAAAQAQTAALTTQVNALRAQLTALQTQVGAAGLQISNLAAALARLNGLESQLNNVQNQITQLLADIARQGGVATAAQISQLQSLGGTLSSLFQAVQSATDLVNGIVNEVIRIFSGTRLP